MPGTFSIDLLEPLAPNTDYVFSAGPSCLPFNPVETWSSAFSTSTDVPFPQTLGTLMETDAKIGDLQVPAGGSCSIEITAAQVSVAVQLDASSQPWRNVLSYETHVDGDLYAPSHSLVGDDVLGGSWEGRGQDLLFVACDPGGAWGGLTPGVHDVQMSATMLDGQVVGETNVLTVDLACGCACSSADAHSNVGVRSLTFLWIAVLLLLAARSRAASHSRQPLPASRAR